MSSERCQWNPIIIKDVEVPEAVDVRFVERDEVGMIRGLPPLDNNAVVGKEGRWSQKKKRLPGLGSANFAFVWIGKGFLSPSTPSTLNDSMKRMGQEAPNLETCLLHAAPVGAICLAVAILVSLLKETPNLKKFDLMNLPLQGSEVDFRELQYVLKEYCPSLEELYYCDTSRARGTADAMMQRTAADCFVSSCGRSTKRLCLKGLLITSANASCLLNLALAPNLEYLHLDVSWEPKLVETLADVITSLKKLVHFSMRIEIDSETPPPDEVLQSSLELLTRALAVPRILILELLVCGTLMSAFFVRPWIDLLEYNYSCQRFDIGIICEHNEQNNWQKLCFDGEAQRLVRLNRDRRNDLLTAFQPHVATPSCWVETLEGLGATNATEDLHSNDILTGVYLFLHQHIGGIAHLALSKKPSGGQRNAMPSAVKELVYTRRDIKAFQTFRSGKEANYAACLAELASKDNAAIPLWSQLALLQQKFADGADVSNSEYGRWVDILAKDHAQRAESLKNLAAVKGSLDAYNDFLAAETYCLQRSKISLGLD